MIDELAISRVLAKYVRCADARDGAAMDALFVTDAFSVKYLTAKAGDFDRLRIYPA
jgi:hypothetical protein